MSVAERKLVAEAWAKAVRTTKQHLMVQIGGAPLPDVLELVRINLLMTSVVLLLKMSLVLFYFRRQSTLKVSKQIPYSVYQSYTSSLPLRNN